ncbi:MAG: NADH-quinone oxidoreductase subunit L [Thermoleophilia bacterium]|nr:NADH-quinone oxidoreductase subunit L [Thermoleophilia bacterium]
MSDVALSGAYLGWFVLALPLLGAIVLALIPGEPSRALTRVIGVGSVAAAFVLVVSLFAQQLSNDAERRAGTSTLWTWVDLGSLQVDLKILVDPLSVLMMLVITGVGSLIILYSTEYMSHDRDYRRFFVEMDFFIFAMLVLVLAANFLFLIVGWALVGLASYLLIGYYHDRPSAVAAAKKAFVINVLGDIGLVLAAFLLVRQLGTLDFAEVFAKAPQGLGDGTFIAEMVALLLFVGAAAKSAQIPLHTWLPDAMEGPTPVSALIHAATMVTAGVYLIVRCNVLYELAPHMSDAVAVVGAVTLFVAATIATVQDDIKRVLAWSTVSQIGYMVMAAGLGLYSSGMFHFLTHAFFKAALFLAAGIVIHALHDEQSLDRMGGLKNHLKVAYFATAAGCLAIAGIPPFSGFFSKDEILAGAIEAGTLGKVLAGVGLVGAGLTAFYMFRLLFRAFHGPEPDGGYHETPHASGSAMAAPVVILAALATVGGFIQIPFVSHNLRDWLEPAITADPGIEAGHGQETLIIVLSLAVAAIGIAAAWWLFGSGPERRLARAQKLPRLRAFLLDQWRFDEVYEAAVVQPGRDLGDAGVRAGERGVGQGPVIAAEAVTGAGARILSRVENGLVRTYAMAVIAGAAIVGAILILAR